MKVLFLDIDGVLNCYTTKERYRGFYGIDPKKVVLLNGLLERTGAKVVVSSTWRKTMPMEELETYLKQQGFKGEIIGRTPSYAGFRHFRANEVNAYLLKMEEPPESYVILDDDSDFDDWQPLVKSTFDTALTPELVEKAVEILSKPMAAVPIAVELVEKAKELVAGVDVDLDEHLEGDVELG